jgi:hypothetical protein
MLRASRLAARATSWFRRLTATSSRPSAPIGRSLSPKSGTAAECGALRRASAPVWVHGTLDEGVFTIDR